MEMIHEKERQIPVHASVDVVVVGSGPSGLAAAIAAQRAGAETMLIERYGCFGGVISQVGVEGFAWYRHEGTIEAGGLVPEFENMSIRVGGANPECQSTSQALDAEMFKYAADIMIEESGVRPLLHSVAVDVVMDGDKITGVIVENKSGRMAIMAKRVIDCTGDADIVALSGAPFTKAPKNELMNVTTMFHCKGVDTEKFNDYVKNDLKPTYADWGGYWEIQTDGKEDDMFSPYFERPFVEAVEEGVVPKEKDVCLGGTWSSVTQYGEVTQLNVVFVGNVDCTDVEDLTRAEIVGRRNALRSIECLRKKVPGFENAQLRNFGMTLGTRESRKVDGMYRLSKEDVMNQGRFEDSVGIFPEFIDGIGYMFLPTTGHYYQIPYGCLVPKKVDNLLVAGRCICTDKCGHASSRNMSCCVTTGQACGIAAAVSIRDGVTTSKVDIAHVQEELTKQNVRFK